MTAADTDMALPRPVEKSGWPSEASVTRGVRPCKDGTTTALPISLLRSSAAADALMAFPLPVENMGTMHEEAEAEEICEKEEDDDEEEEEDKYEEEGGDADVAKGGAGFE